MEEKNKGGRPTDDPKIKDVRVRVSQSMYQKLWFYSREHSMTIAETVREALESFLK